MAKADVLALVDTLSDDTATAVTIDEFYDDVVFEMAQGIFPGPSLTNAAYVEVVAGTSHYEMPDDAVRELAIIHDHKDLLRDERQGAEISDKDWRSSLGEPAAYVTGDEDQDFIALVPVPDVSGDTVGVATPFIPPFVRGNLTIIYTEERDDVHLDEELPLALEILAREMARDSDHHDGDMSKAVKKLAGLLFGLIHRES